MTKDSKNWGGSNDHLKNRHVVSEKGAQSFDSDTKPHGIKIPAQQLIIKICSAHHEDNSRLVHLHHRHSHCGLRHTTDLL